MNNNSKLQHRFDALHICVLIPTYNNAMLIADVVKDVLQYTSNIIIVNDGSTDTTLEVLSTFENIDLVSYTPNKGKGAALKNGFEYAYEKGFRYAITMDSDGQHYAKDLVQFVDYIEQHPNSLIIGSRNMDQEHIPNKSMFGNKFSNFWFWVETGHTLSDTQSGYRLYPLEAVVNTRYFSTKYEFEIEVPVRASWKGVAIAAVPVAVYYPPEEERVSHFRPFKDFVRISILNTFLTLIALLWIHPRDFFKKIFTKEGLKDLWRNSFVKPNESNYTKAISLAFGVFMGIIPIWGFQLAIGIPLSIFFKMNKPLFLIGANISIFPFTPVIWLLSLMTGKLVLGYKDWQYDLQHLLTLDQVKEAGIAFFLGGAVLAIVMGILTFVISLLLFQKFRKSNSNLVK